MPEIEPRFRELAALYAGTTIEFSHLRAITIAQWMLESGFGQSQLARQHLNYGGMKWRAEMKDFASAVDYEAHDGKDKYCKFASQEKFIGGYWRFIDRAPYNGWRNHAGSAESYIRFVGAIYTPTHLYADSVLRLLPTAMNLLAEAGGDAIVGPPPGTREPFSRPAIKEFIESPNHGSRNGRQIRRIVVHYTTSRNVQGTIAHFLNPASEVSAHYVIARNGDIYQMVRDADAAWHARSANAESIGIEHSANQGDRITPEQEASSVALLRWLVSTYKLAWDDIEGHRFVPGNNTICPDHLFGDNTHEALREWVNSKVKPAA